MLTRVWPSSCRYRRFSKLAPVGALLARKCSGPSNLDCTRARTAAARSAHVRAQLLLGLLSSPIPRVVSCTSMLMEYPDFGQRTLNVPATSSARPSKTLIKPTLVIRSVVKRRLVADPLERRLAEPVDYLQATTFGRLRSSM